MGTHAFIGIKIGKTYKGIYLHFDGYPEHAGKILNEHYKTRSKILKLMKLGDISSLGPEIGKKQDFNNPVSGTTLAYKRDRGESGTEAKIFNSYEEFVKEAQDIGEYVYLFEKGKWRQI